MRKNERGITLIALVVTIVVLLILAGVSISMLTGENGIITQAQQSKLQTEIGKEKEYITLSVSAIKGDKMSRGDTSEITSSELQTEMNKYTDEATVTGSGTLMITYESGRNYEVDQDGSITQKEELTPEEAKKIVFATGCAGALIVETADGTVYYVDDLQQRVIQKIEITDEEVITTNGIRVAGENFFIDDKGKVYTWGWNGLGQLGNGTNENSNKPICISDIPDNALNGKNTVEVQSNGNTVIALDSEGKVYTWGSNEHGQLGNGTEEYYSNKPICISEMEENVLNEKNIVEVQSGYDTMIAIDNEGKVYTWGDNGEGQLGNGTNEDSNVPICISDIEDNILNGENIVEVQSGGYTMIVLDSEGKVYTWGYNNNGQLGNGTKDDSDEPICISDINGNALNGKNIVEMQSTVSTMIAIDNEGKVYTWGRNNYGQLGNGTWEDSNEPICITDIEDNILNGKNIVEVQNGGSIIIALDDGGKVYIWGENSNEPICISDIPENELYNKKIKFINITFTVYNNLTHNYISFITKDGELYNYYSQIANPI